MVNKMTLDTNWAIGVFKLMFHLLYHLFEELHWFGNLETLDTKQFKRFNVDIKFA